MGCPRSLQEAYGATLDTLLEPPCWQAGMGMGGMAMGMGMEQVAAPSTCVLMKNMFDPNGEDEKNDKDFFSDLKEDVKDECGK